MKKQLGVFDLSMIIMGFVIGMGIFKTPASVAAATPTPFIFYLCWIMGGIVALCGALTYAEIGSRLPVTGGYYKVFSYAYHPSIAFGINCIILVSNAASLGAVALIGSEYFSGVMIPVFGDLPFLKNANNAQQLKNIQVGIAITSIFIFYLVNMLGLKMSSRTQNILMAIKIGLIVLIIAPLFFVEGAGHQTQAVITSPVDGNSFISNLKAFGIGFVGVNFTYGGYQQTINFGEEVKNPNKNIPRGIFIAITVIITLYVVVNYAYVNVIGFEQLKTAQNIAAIMTAKIFGAKGQAILSVLLFLGVLAYINGSLLSNPRVMYAMATDKVLPAAFAKTNKRDVLFVSLTLFALLGAGIVFWAERFEKILGFSMFLDCFGMALSAAGIFYLRKKTAHLNESGIYKMKLYPLLPLVFIAAYIFIAISIILDYKNNGNAALTGIMVLIVFIIIYFIFYRRQPRKHLIN